MTISDGQRRPVTVSDGQWWSVVSGGQWRSVISDQWYSVMVKYGQWRSDISYLLQFIFSQNICIKPSKITLIFISMDTHQLKHLRNAFSSSCGSLQVSSFLSFIYFCYFLQKLLADLIHFVSSDRSHFSPANSLYFSLKDLLDVFVRCQNAFKKKIFIWLHCIFKRGSTQREALATRSVEKI